MAINRKIVYVTSEQPIQNAVMNRNLLKVKELVKNGVSVNTVLRQFETDMTIKMPLLHMAVLTDSPDMVQYLIDSGADLTLTDGFDGNALACAVISQRINSLRILVKTKIDFNHVDSGKKTPFTHNFDSQPNQVTKEIYRLLITHCPKIKATDQYGGEFIVESQQDGQVTEFSGHGILFCTFWSRRFLNRENALGFVEGAKLVSNIEPDLKEMKITFILNRKNGFYKMIHFASSQIIPNLPSPEFNKEDDPKIKLTFSIATDRKAIESIMNVLDRYLETMQFNLSDAASINTDSSNSSNQQPASSTGVSLKQFEAFSNSIKTVIEKQNEINSSDLKLISESTNDSEKQTISITFHKSSPHYQFFYDSCISEIPNLSQPATTGRCRVTISLTGIKETQMIAIKTALNDYLTRLKHSASTNNSSSNSSQQVDTSPSSTTNPQQNVAPLTTGLAQFGNFQTHTTTPPPQTQEPQPQKPHMN